MRNVHLSRVGVVTRMEFHDGSCQIEHVVAARPAGVATAGGRE
jgi:hypothetical protein